MKRLRLTGAANFPRDFVVPGACARRSTARCLAAVPNVTPELLDDLRAKWHAEVRVEDLNLEEIFVELNSHV